MAGIGTITMGDAIIGVLHCGDYLSVMRIDKGGVVNKKERRIMLDLIDELERVKTENRSESSETVMNIARMEIQEQGIEERLLALASVGVDVTIRPVVDGIFEIDIDHMNGDKEQFHDKNLERAISNAEQDVYFGNHFVRL